MKKATLFFTFCVWSLLTHAQNNSVLWQADLNQAMTKAKAAGKLVFVEAYLPTCPACQAMEPNFSKKEVADKYNAGFINYKMDLSKPGARKFLDDKKIYVPSFPQFFFFDGDGKIVHQSEARPTLESVLDVANDALDKNNWSSNYKQRFESGDREFNFLVKYGVYTRVIMDTLQNHKVANELFQVFPKEDLGSNLSWLATKKVVTDIDNGFFKYWVEHIPQAAELEKNAGHAGQEMGIFGGIVQNSIFTPRAKEYSTEKLTYLRECMNKIQAGQYADTYLWEFETIAKIREGKPDEALKIGEKMVQKFGQNGPSLIFIAKVFNDNFKDNTYINTANSWLNTAKPMLKENNHLAEYYYELARINKKEGKTDLTMKNATEALKYAKLAKIDLKKFEQFDKL